MLTKEEKESITRLKFKSDTYSLIVAKLIDRLVAENEELQGDKKHLLGVAQMLQFKLDAIKKAWGPFVKFLNAVLVKQGDEPDELPMLGMGRSIHDVPTMGEVRTLDKLIG